MSSSLNISKLSIAKEVLQTEANAILSLSETLGSEFEHGIDTILSCLGKVVVTGIGKSGLIGKKMAATMASTGTPSFFLHPVEALHGDLGTVASNDIIILLSNSGDTDELLKLIPFFKEQKNKLIAITGNQNSILARNSDIVISSKVDKEACPLELAPTTSTTAMLAIGDALAITLMKCREFNEDDFARYHPSGFLGKKLLTKVSDLMRSDFFPLIEEETIAEEIVETIAKGKLGLCVVLKEDKVKGVITDGDISRAMKANGKDFFEITAKEIMTRNPTTIDPGSNVSQASKIMNKKKINTLLVCKEEKLHGFLQIYDINNLNK